MRIAIDASRTTARRVTGTEYYATALIRALIQLNTTHDITLYFRDAPTAGLFPESALVKHRVLRLRRVWTHARFAAALWQDRPDVTFVPAHTLPFVFPGKAVVTVHDLGFKYFPQAHPVQQRLYLDWTTRYSARRANLVLADSQATAADLTRFYNTPPHKIHVVYPGVDAPPVNSVNVREKYQLPETYFLFIGTLQPRKNIQRIVQAFAAWQRRYPDSGLGLVLAGGKGWLYDPAWVRDTPNVHLPGYIDEADKGALLQGAFALVFPTLYEGFGFPVIEAMHRELPVIASATSSLPELSGEAALLVDPLDVKAITTAMGRLWEDAALRQHLREAGRRQRALFTWENAALNTLKAFERLQ